MGGCGLATSLLGCMPRLLVILIIKRALSEESEFNVALISELEVIAT